MFQCVLVRLRATVAYAVFFLPQFSILGKLVLWFTSPRQGDIKFMTVCLHFGLLVRSRKCYWWDLHEKMRWVLGSNLDPSFGSLSRYKIYLYLLSIFNTTYTSKIPIFPFNCFSEDMLSLSDLVYIY